MYRGEAKPAPHRGVLVICGPTATGKTVGDRVDFGGLLGSAPVIGVHPESSALFVPRGGRIPAPLQSLRN